MKIRFLVAIGFAVLLTSTSNKVSAQGEVFEDEGLSGWKNAQGDVLLRAEYSFLEESGKYLRAEKKGKWGYYDVSGVQALPMDFDSIGEFADGFVMIRKNNKWGLYNEKLSAVMPIDYDDLSPQPKEGIVVFRRGDRKGFADIKGKEIIPASTYQEVNDFQNNYALSMTPEAKWGAINSKGKVVIPNLYEVAEIQLPAGQIVVVKKNFTWDVYIPAQEKLLSYKYDGYPKVVNGYMRVIENGLMGYLDESGNMAIKPQFQKAADFNEIGRASVTKAGKVMIINTKGEVAEK